MARKLKEEAYAARRNEILAAAQRLVYTKGFDQMTIQDILDDLQISKGAFYHYFESKAAVMEALVERMVDEIEPTLIDIVQDAHLSALDKMQRYFDTAVRWKTARKSVMLSLLRAWYADENAILRQKVFASMVDRIGPLITEIIRQGVREGVFKTAYPDYIFQINIYLLQGLSDTFVGLLFSGETGPSVVQRAEDAVAAYTDALGRVLGVPAGTLELINMDTIKEWFIPVETYA
jgi:AcrR family transcriptional regulator